MSDDFATDLAAARDRIASIAIGGEGSPDRLGSLALRPHQRVAVGRLLGIVARYGGALLADAVGLGKTYVGLAVAREHRRPLVVCPAGLRSMWERAMSTANLSFPVMSIESLARGDRPAFEPDIIIVDEAHHLRTPATRRYEAIAGLAHRCRLLLVSATPLHNSRRDLTAVLALFVGSAVHGWTDRELARLIVRRDERSADQHLPTLVGPQALSPGVDDDCLDAICALPLAVPAADEGTAAALATISTVHIWASSRAALVASLRMRRAKAIALHDAVSCGHLPTAYDLALWRYADDSLQLAFPFCAPGTGPAIDPTEIQLRLDQYIRAVNALLTTCRDSPDPDVARAELLRTLRQVHTGSRIVAFSQYAQTVTALGRLLRTEPGVAVVTAKGARIASGSVRRQEVLDQFAGDAPRTQPIERVDLLLSTDLLSEGVDLRGASVVVNLDLPWNPARVEQRVGRARRIGSPHASIHVYTFVPPTAAERMLMLQRRLAGKVRMADAIVGGMHALASSTEGMSGATRAPVETEELLRAKLSTWVDPLRRQEGNEPIISAATARAIGWLAVVLVDGRPRLVQNTDGRIDDDPNRLLTVVESIGEAMPVDAEVAATVLKEIETWMSSRKLGADIGIDSAYPSAKRAVLDRISRSVARAPRHRRTAILAAAQRARAGVSAIAGVGAERILEELVRSASDDEAWIQSVEAFGALHARANPSRDGRPDRASVGAVILLRPARR